ncbi:MAG: single-stranded DNA-binding protein [Candidatus Omnitrophica bacterium]|nr:single-stranded DNA-binding protein [Candidatus Omnitrophota bacterium]
MANLNRVFLIGNLTRDPELRYTPSGTAVTNLRIAVNRRYKTQTGEPKEETAFLTVVAWGKQAETCSQFLSKGKPIFVEGRLQSRSWEAQDGQKRNVLEVRASRVQFLGKVQISAEAQHGEFKEEEESLESLLNEGATPAPASEEKDIDSKEIPF